MWLKSWINNFHTNIKYTLYIFCEIASRLMPQDLINYHWWLVNIGSGNGMVPLVKKPLLEQMLT